MQKTVSREQLFSNSRAWRTTSRRTTSHQRTARTAKTNLEFLLLERLLLHLCVLARALCRKGSLPRLCGERILLHVIDNRVWSILNKSSAGRVHTQRHGTRLAKSVDSDFTVAGSLRQPITNNTIHMRCSRHTHWVHASLSRREKIDKNAIFKGIVEIGSCGGRE